MKRRAFPVNAFYWRRLSRVRHGGRWRFLRGKKQPYRSKICATWLLMHRADLFLRNHLWPRKPWINRKEALQGLPLGTPRTREASSMIF